MWARRMFIATISAVAVLPLATVPASAAPPGNDESAGATAVRLGDRVVEDTREATTSAADATLNEGCGAPATNASVWFTYTPAVARRVVLDMTASNYSGGLMVFQGTPSADSLLACGPGVIGLSVAANRTYTIMAFSDTDTIGGRLVLAIKQPPPPPRVRVTLARGGVALRGGAARLHGTYICRNGQFADLSGALFQRAGRLKITAEFFQEVRCDGRRHVWRSRAVSQFATYARGRARARVTVAACGVFECRNATARHRIHLVGTGGGSHQRSAQPSVTRQVRPYPLVASERRWASR